MSNVLIGIIGVILFIGLALAGALILGDDFRSSKSTTAAATVTSQLQQISAAIDMYQLKTGQTMLASTSSSNLATLQPRFLKSTPVNPLNAGYIYNTIDATGNFGAVAIGSIYTTVGNDSVAREICKSVEEQAGSPDPEAAMAQVTNYTAGVNARRTVGCFRNSDGYYYPFIKK